MPRRANKNKKKTTNSGLGRAIRNKYGGKPNRENHASGRVKRKDHLIDSFASTANHQNDRNFKSITECNNIQQFIDTMSYEQKAEDEEEDEMKLISYDPQESMESKEKRYHSELKKTESFNYENLPIPRKPSWNENTTKQELLSMEEKVFINWRRGLANTAKETNLEMTPFEKNIQVWKQLWKVIEISHLLILIVDARNPLAFISRDLFKYVSEVSNDKKQCILLINKADYLSPLQRKYWMQYFKQQNIKILYFSAMKEEIKLNLLTKSNRDKLSLEQIEIVKDNTTINNDNNSIEDILSCDKLIKIFESFKIDNMDKLKVGLIGYPNVGKSSIINVLMKSKRVSTGSTPGKTKHFQTLNLNDNIILCDCPGLVFPTLVNSKSDMILNGVIPIDNLTDFITPTRLMVHRVSIKKINNYYNLRLPINNKKQIKFITVYDVLDSYCHQKKMYNKSKVPNRNEAARILLKDYVKGKLIYNHYPPNLNSRNKFLFYNGKNNINHNDDNDDNDNDDDDNNEVIDNVLDQNKLNNIDNVEEEEEDEDEDETQEQEGMTDLEFLELWKHPMEEYGDSLGTSKKKHEKKVRVMRRIEKKTQKQNRKYRRDADNYLYGSNAVIVSSVPTIKGKHSKVQL